MAMMANKFKFDVIYRDKKSKARVGRITTAHGEIDTPAFVPVGTQATVKSLTPQNLKELLPYRLTSYHNLYFINHLVREIKEEILEGRFEKLKKEWLGI